MTEFAALLARLARAEVRFIVVGGLAVAQAGFVRTTLDVDVLIEASPENAAAFIDAMSGFGDGVAAELSPEDFTLEEGAIRILDVLPIDVFTQMTGLVYTDLLPQSDTHDILGHPVRFLGIDGLIQLKAPSVRPKDQIDVDALRRIQRGETL